MSNDGEEEVRQYEKNKEASQGVPPEAVELQKTNPKSDNTKSTINIEETSFMGENPATVRKESSSNLIERTGLGRFKDEDHVKELADHHKKVVDCVNHLNSMISQKTPTQEHVNNLKENVKNLKKSFSKSHGKLGKQGATHGTKDDLSNEIEKAVESAENSINRKKHFDKTGETEPKKGILSKIGDFFLGSSSDKSSDSKKSSSSGGGGSSRKNKKLKYMAAYALICIIVFTMTYFVISDSAFTTKSGLSEKKVKDNLKNKAVKKQIDLGLYWGMGLILFWILMVSIHLGE